MNYLNKDYDTMISQYTSSITVIGMCGLDIKVSNCIGGEKIINYDDIIKYKIIIIRTPIYLTFRIDRINNLKTKTKIIQWNNNENIIFITGRNEFNISYIDIYDDEIKLDISKFNNIFLHVMNRNNTRGIKKLYKDAHKYKKEFNYFKNIIVY